MAPQKNDFASRALNDDDWPSGILRFAFLTATNKDQLTTNN